MLESILDILPFSLRNIIGNLPENIRFELEEIRVRESRPLEIVYESRYSFLTKQGKLTEHPRDAYCPGRDDSLKLLDLLTNHSLYTFEEQLKKGYITIQGGHRVGLAGRTVLENGKVKQIREISSFNFRVAREVIGTAEPLLPYLLDPAEKTVHHTLIISPPQRGKTTVIRDLARLISYGAWPSPAYPGKGLKTAIVDERSELAACVGGIPVFDVGPRTDVLDGCPKAEGMMMMIRSMSPDVLIVDEIGRPEDAEAVHEALHAGVRVIATAHGRDIADAGRRPALRGLMAERVFSRYVVLHSMRRTGKGDTVFDAEGNRLNDNAVRIKVGR